MGEQALQRQRGGCHKQESIAESNKNKGVYEEWCMPTQTERKRERMKIYEGRYFLA